MTLSEYKTSSTPKKRKLKETATPGRPHPSSDDSDADMDVASSAKTEVSLPVPLQLEQLTREFDVRFYIGLTSTESFKCVFDYLLPKAMNMQYWRGPKQT